MSPKNHRLSIDETAAHLGTNAIVFTIRPDTTVTQVAPRKPGCATRDLVGRRLQDWVIRQDRDRLSHALNECLDTGISGRVQVTDIATKTPRILTLEPIDSAGTRVGVLCVALEPNASPKAPCQVNKEDAETFWSYYQERKDEILRRLFQVLDQRPTLRPFRVHTEEHEPFAWLELLEESFEEAISTDSWERFESVVRSKTVLLAERGLSLSALFDLKYVFHDILDRELSHSPGSDPTETQRILSGCEQIGHHTLAQASLAFLSRHRESTANQLAEVMRAQCQAESTNRIFATLFETSRDAILVKNLDGEVLQWNRACQELYGYSAAEAVGRHIDFIIPEERRSELSPLFSRLRQGLRVSTFQTVRRAKNGCLIEIELSISPVLDDRGSPFAASAIARVISERMRLRRQLEESNRELAEILAESAVDKQERLGIHFLQHLREGCQIIDHDYRYLYLNDAAVKQSRKCREELLGHTMMECYEGIEDTKMFEVLTRCLKERSFEVMENEFHYPDGSSRWFELRMKPLSGGVGILSVDIEERKKTDLELRRSNQDLDDFARAAAHDLQEPLRQILTFSELLLQDLGDQRLSEQALMDMMMICESATRMQTLISDQLALARLRDRQLKISAVDINTCIDRALENLTESVKEVDTRFHREQMPTLKADPGLLTRVYQNLVSNALKFRSEEQVKIEFTAQQEDGRWVLGVKDNGIGVPSDHLEMIFRPLKRLHSRGKYPGTGIGLAICQKIVERHGGLIWVESHEEEGGAHFRFILDRGRPA
jgi:PAS domain S-box-containing protein